MGEEFGSSEGISIWPGGRPERTAPGTPEGFEKALGGRSSAGGVAGFHESRVVLPQELISGPWWPSSVISVISVVPAFRGPSRVQKVLWYREIPPAPLLPKGGICLRVEDIAEVGSDSSPFPKGGFVPPACATIDGPTRLSVEELPSSHLEQSAERRRQQHVKRLARVALSRTERGRRPAKHPTGVQGEMPCPVLSPHRVRHPPPSSGSSVRRSWP